MNNTMYFTNRFVKTPEIVLEGCTERQRETETGGQTDLIMSPF